MFHPFSQLSQVDVTRNDFVPGIHNRHQRLFEILPLHTRGVKKGSVCGTIDSVGDLRSAVWLHEDSFHRQLIFGDGRLTINRARLTSAGPGNTLGPMPWKVMNGVLRAASEISSAWFQPANKPARYPLR
jgi:hypothetical protein